MRTYHFNIIQGSEEWHDIRIGRIGGSEAAALLVNGKSAHGLGTAAVSLIYEKVGELFAGPSLVYENYAMQRGNELEPRAREAYETATFTDVQACGYVQVGDYFGYSPDGLIGQEGLIEIKCPLAPEFVRFAHTGEIDPKHIAQMQWGLWITGREYCDYIMHHPDFFEHTIILRVLPDPAIHAKFQSASEAAEKLIREILEKLGANGNA